MANYCFTAPILPGKEDKLRRFIREEIEHNPNHDRVFHLAGVSHEQVWIQHTPMGDFSVVCVGTENPAKSFENLARSADPWAAKFRDFLMEVHGLDISKQVPINDQVLNWGVMEKTHAM